MAEGAGREAYPWNDPDLDGWVIVGMNHYFVEGRRCLFVAMIKDDRCIKAEGLHEVRVWADLRWQAVTGRKPTHAQP